MATLMLSAVEVDQAKSASILSTPHGIGWLKGDGEGLGLGDGEGEGSGLGVGLGFGEGLGVGEGVGDGLGDGVGEGRRCLRAKAWASSSILKTSGLDLRLVT